MKFSTATFTAVIGLIAGVATAAPSLSFIHEMIQSYEGYTVYRFTVDSEKNLDLLRRAIADPENGLSPWSHEVHMGKVDINFSPDAKQRFANTLLGQIPNSIMIENVQALVDKEQRHMASNSFRLHHQVTRGDTSNVTAASIFSDYQSLESLVAFYSTLPGLKQVKIGNSYLGVTIPGFEFGTGSKRIMYHGGIHAREWISPAVVAYITNHLVTDPSAANLLSTFTFTVIPVVNVDGYAYTRKNDRMWRKNRKPNKGSRCTGTDPNRNFDYKWAYDGASSDPCAEDYYGAKAFDAPETKAVADYIQKVGGFVGYIDFHSYSELWMFPNGYTCDGQVKDYDVLLAGSQKAVDAIQGINGERFQNGDICNTIYPASGSSVDWTYNVAGVTYSYAVELRPNQDDDQGYGFLLPASQIPAAGAETTAAVMALWNFMAQNL